MSDVNHDITDKFKFLAEFTDGRLKSAIEAANSLNNKALGLLAFNAVVFGIVIRRGTFVQGPLYITEVFFLLTIMSFFGAFVFSAFACMPFGLDYRAGAKETIEKSEDDEITLYKYIAVNTAEAFELNLEKINSRGRHIKLSVYCILFGLTALFLWYLSSVSQ